MIIIIFSEITLPATLKVKLLAPKVTSRGMYVTFHHTLSFESQFGPWYNDMYKMDIPIVNASVTNVIFVPENIENNIDGVMSI